MSYEIYDLADLHFRLKQESRSEQDASFFLLCFCLRFLRFAMKKYRFRLKQEKRNISSLFLPDFLRPALSLSPFSVRKKVRFTAFLRVILHHGVLCAVQWEFWAVCLFGKCAILDDLLIGKNAVFA